MNDLHGIDLNLLVALDALLAECHVTRAAERIGLSQPAMSNALARLRRSLGDPILVRTARGMQPTPRGRRLAVAVRPLLRQLTQALRPDLPFTPAEARRGFSLRLSDLLGRLLLPGLTGRLATAAPGIRLDILHLPPERTVQALEADELDLAVSAGLAHGRSIRAFTLLRDDIVCLMRRGHPAARGALTLGRYLALRHLRVAVSPADSRFVDAALERLQQRRDIAVNLPHWLMVPELVRTSDLVATVPLRFAAVIADEGLTMRPMEFVSGRFAWSLYWHQRYEADPANCWLRQQIQAVAAAL